MSTLREQAEVMLAEARVEEHRAQTEADAAQRALRQAQDRAEQAASALQAASERLGHASQALEHLRALEPAEAPQRPAAPVVPITGERQVGQMHRVVPEPRDGPATPDRERVREQMRQQAQERHEAEAKAKRRPRGHDGDPLSPYRRQGGGTDNYPSGVRRPDLAVTNVSTSKLDLDNPSVAAQAHADLVEVLLQEAGEALSQHQLAEQVAEFEDCPYVTAKAHVSDGVKVLLHESRVCRTGEKRLGPTGTKHNSPVVKLATTGEERAAPGIHDDEYEGTTTRWPTGGQAPAQGTHVSVETTAYESKR